MYEFFTDRARKIMQLANQEAQGLNHPYIGTEHILLGLIKEGSGVAVNVLTNLEVDLPKLRSVILKIVQRGPLSVPLDERPPQLSSAKNVIEYAMAEAHNLNHNYVGSEHLLLGLLREEETVAAQALAGQGLKRQQVRDETARLLSGGAQSMPLPQPSSNEIEDLPDELKAHAAELDAEIGRLTAAKEEAVANQEFEVAASLRDQADKLHRKRRALFPEWFVNWLIEPSWLSANDSAVLKLARIISEPRSWGLLPKLADALECAGCTNARLLGHCRQPAGHSKHCWVVDLLLARA